MLREYVQVFGQLCRHHERSRSSFMKQRRCITIGDGLPALVRSLQCSVRVSGRSPEQDAQPFLRVAEGGLGKWWWARGTTKGFRAHSAHLAVSLKHSVSNILHFYGMFYGNLYVCRS